MADAFQVDKLLSRLQPGEHDFGQFFRSPTGSLSMTIAHWAAGSDDHQQPHTEDEVYYIVSGRGRLAIGTDDAALGPGSVAFVAAGVEHHFHDIVEDLRVLIFWSPARTGPIRSLPD
jgi:mannose-6-phosphate isomerase-like protein (cupin superfamily)